MIKRTTILHVTIEEHTNKKEYLESVKEISESLMEWITDNYYTGKVMLITTEDIVHDGRIIE